MNLRKMSAVSSVGKRRLALCLAVLVLSLSAYAAPSVRGGQLNNSNMAVGCVPQPAPFGQPTHCTVTVTDTSTPPSPPTGPVIWQSCWFMLPNPSCPDGPGGYFSPMTATCTLTPTSSSSSSCSIDFIPASPTSTSVNCTPSTVAVNQQTSCAATVTQTHIDGIYITAI